MNHDRNNDDIESNNPPSSRLLVHGSYGVYTEPRTAPFCLILFPFHLSNVPKLLQSPGGSGSVSWTTDVSP